MFGLLVEREIVMLDHVGFVVKELDEAVAFDEHCLAPVGLKVIERHDYGAVIFARSKKDEFPFIWIGTATPNFWKQDHKPSSCPIHLCFRATSKEAVDRFHQAAVEFGG